MTRNITEAVLPSPRFHQKLMVVREDEDHEDEVYTTATQDLHTHRNVWTMGARDFNRGAPC